MKPLIHFLSLLLMIEVVTYDTFDTGHGKTVIVIHYSEGPPDRLVLDNRDMRSQKMYDAIEKIERIRTHNYGEQDETKKASSH